MTIYPLKLYKLRCGIETNYYEQKMFWELGNYKVRTTTAIEYLLNLTNARHTLSQQIHKEVFFSTLVSKAQSSINSSALLKALQTLIGSNEQAA